MARATIAPRPTARHREQRAGDLLVEAMALMDELLNYVKHTGDCPHPRGTCKCGLPQVLVKARRFGVFLSALGLLLTGCTANLINIPFGEQAKQRQAARAMERLAPSAAPPVQVQALVSRPAVNEAIINVPFDHMVAPLAAPTLTLEELVDRFRTNRQSLTILLVTPNTNPPAGKMMPSRKRL